MKSTWEINIGGNLFAGLDNVLSGVNAFERAAGSAESAFDSLFDGKKIDSIGSKVWGIRQSLTGINEVFQGVSDFSKPFLGFDQTSRDLQSVTGVTEELRTQINDFSKDSAYAFGGNATKTLDTYTTILSKLGPELAKNPEILRAMGDNVAITSKLMKGDTAGAVGILTTAMNQYGVSIENPTEALAKMTEMMNIMQASALVGSSELPDLQAGIATSGATAHAAGVQFTEMTAALQVLDKGSKKGAEGGVALRNTLARLGEGRFMPEKTMTALQSAGVNVDVLANKSSTLADRLTELSKIKNDSALVSQFFGTENMAAGQYLLDNIDLLKQYTNQIGENKNAAVDSANIVMSSWQTKIDQMNAWFDNIKIGIAETFAPFTPAIEGITSVTGGLLQMAPGIVGMIDLWGKLNMTKKLSVFWDNAATVSTVIYTGAISLAEIAMETFGLTTIIATGGIIIAIGALVAGLVWAWNHFEGFRKFMYQLWAAAKEVFYGLGMLIIDSLTAPLKLIMGLATFDIGMIKSVVTDPINHAKDMANGAANAWNAEGQNFDAEKARKASHYGEDVTTGNADPTKAMMSGLGMGGNMPVTPLVKNMNPTKSGSNPSALNTGGKGGSSAGSGSGSGGSRNITVTIKSLVEKIEIHSTSIRESTGSIKRQVAEALTAAVSDFEVQIAQQPA